MNFWYILNKNTKKNNLFYNINNINKLNLNNLEKKNRKKTFFQQFKFKLSNYNKQNDFNFKTSNWILTTIYLIFFVITPIIFSLIKNYIFKNNNQIIFISIFISNLLPIFGLIISIGIDWKTMIKKGGWASYSHNIFGFISLIFVLLFFINTKIISGKESDITSLATTFLIQQLFQLLGSILVLIFCKTLRKKIIITLKKLKLDLLTWIFIFAFISSFLNMIFNIIFKFNSFNNLKNYNNSKNQEILDLLMKSPYGIFVLILSTIFLAPINEEISYRYGIFIIIRHRWLAYIISLIYFPSMHVMDNGDWNNIIGYLGFSITLPLLFIMTGNTTHTIGLHMFSNIIATIYNFINKN